MAFFQLLWHLDCELNIATLYCTVCTVFGYSSTYSPPTGFFFLLITILRRAVTVLFRYGIFLYHTCKSKGFALLGKMEFFYIIWWRGEQGLAQSGGKKHYKLLWQINEANLRNTQFQNSSDVKIAPIIPQEKEVASCLGFYTNCLVSYYDTI